MNIQKIRLGDKIEYRETFGSGGRVIGIVAGKGSKRGQPLVDLSNGTWAYCHQVDRILNRDWNAC